MEMLAIILLGTLTGNEFAVGAFFHPLLAQLTDDQHAAGRRGTAKLFGRVAPFWYASTILSLIVSIFLAHNQFQQWLFGLSAALAISAMLFTFVGPLPINNRIVRWDLNNLSVDWKQECKNWDKLHNIRTSILFASLIALSAGVSL